MLATRYSLSPTSRALWALVAVAVAMLLAYLMQPHFDEVGIAMVYMVAVIVVVVTLGFWPAVATSLLGVVLFDYIHVRPHFSFSRQESEHLLMLAVMLATAATISWMKARMRRKARLIETRAAIDAALLALGEELAGDLTVDEIIVVTGRHIARISPLCDGNPEEPHLKAMARLAEQAIERHRLRELARRHGDVAGNP